MHRLSTEEVLIRFDVGHLDPSKVTHNIYRRRWQVAGELTRAGGIFQPFAGVVGSMRYTRFSDSREPELRLLFSKYVLLAPDIYTRTPHLMYVSDSVVDDFFVKLFVREIFE